MAVLYRCTKGHDWEESMDATLVGGAVHCPQCGEKSVELVPETPSFPSIPLFLPAQGESGSDVTLVRSSSASTSVPMPASGSQQHLEGETLVRASSIGAPVVPSQRLAPLPPESLKMDLVHPAARVPSISGYEILGELGKGGMGIVYRAKQTALGRVVALKMIRAGVEADYEELSRFRTEAQAVARLQHPNIVQIFEVGEQGEGLDAKPYMALEFVDGGSLADRLKGEPLTMIDSARIVETLARAVHFAHEHGVIHRDLKPGNVLLMSDGSPKVTDFGLAKTVDGIEKQHQTQSGQVLGTPAYMAPEQARGTGDVGPHSDTYALGVILYQLVTGRLPFVAPSPIEVMALITTVEPPPPSRFVPLARDLQTVIMKCLEKDPRRRYESSQALAEDLRRFLAHEPILARPVGFGERAVRWVRRRPAVAVLLAMVLLCVLGVGTMLGVEALARQQREAKARQQVRDALADARKAAAMSLWEEARVRISTALSIVEDNPNLTNLMPELDSLREQVEGNVKACEATSLFQKKRNSSLFLATLAIDPMSIAQARREVDAALKIGGASDGECQLAEAFLTPQHKKGILTGRYELLLVLADLVGQERPGQTPAQIRAGATEALGILDQAASLGMRTHAFHLRRARYLEQAGDATGAVAERKLAAKQMPENEFDFYLAGGEYYQSFDLKAAAEAYSQSLRKDPSQFWPRYFLALCHVRLGELKAARDNLTSCLGQEQVVWIYLLRGFVEGQLGRYTHAEADFQSAKSLVEKQAGPGALYVLYNNRAVTHLGMRQYDAAEADLRKAIEIEPGQFQAHLTLAQLFLIQKKLPQAKTALNAAITAAVRQYADNELDANTLLLLYRSRYRLLLELPTPDINGALAALQAVIDLKDAEIAAKARAARERGHLFLRSERHDEALSAYDLSIKLLPTDPEAQRWRADTLFKLKRYRESADGFSAYLSAGGKPVVNVYRGRAAARMQIGESELALSDLTLALGMQPNDVSLRSTRGRAYLACHAYQLAAGDFDEALRVDPKLVSALEGRAVARLHINKPREAAADAERAVELTPEGSRVLLWAAGVLAQTSEQVRDHPRDRETYANRAFVLLRQGIDRMPAAERATYWRETIRKDPALRPLRSNDAFSRLDRQYGRS